MKQLSNHMNNNIRRISYMLMTALVLSGIVLIPIGFPASAFAEAKPTTVDKGSFVSNNVYVVMPHMLKVRSGPGKKYSVVHKLKRGTEVTVLESDKDWWHVGFSGKSGYVSKDYLKPASGDTDSIGNANIYIAKRDIQVRATGSIDGKLLGKLNKGTEINVMERKGKWWQINYFGQPAWIRARHIKRK